MISVLEASEGWVPVRTFLSVQEQDLLWELRAEGLPMRAVARRIGRSGGTVDACVLRFGGVRPAQRQRRRGQLTAAEREEISRGVAGRESVRSIARRLGRSPSTISRELARNGGSRRYRATRAEQAAWERARRPKPNKLASSPRLRAVVEEKLALQWAPQQIAGWLVDTYPDEPEMQVSHGDGCTCGKTVTVPETVMRKIRQWPLWGTCVWQALYGQRNAVDTLNSKLRANGLRRGYTRVFGKNRNDLLLRFMYAAVNIHDARIWRIVHQQPPRRRTAGRDPSTGTTPPSPTSPPATPPTGTGASAVTANRPARRRRPARSVGPKGPFD